MLFKLLLIGICISSFLFLPTVISQVVSFYSDRYESATVKHIYQKEEVDRNGFTTNIQKYDVIIDKTKKQAAVENDVGLATLQGKEIQKNDKVVLLKTSTSYLLFDHNRLIVLGFLMLLFFWITVFVVGKKGIGSLIGLGVSFGIIFLLLIPSILQGANPVVASIISAIFIMIATMVFSHGPTLKTGIALLATTLSLLIAGVLSFLAVYIGHISGISVDASSYLKIAGFQINLQGLLLGGIIISLLGILDDITITQTSAVMEIFKTNKKLLYKELFMKSFSVGRDHIASVVNTLVLVYAGVSMPLLIILYINPSNQPLWILLNGELIATEIIRALTGSIGLILSVPFTTAIACYFVIKKTQSLS